jgi:hypothetical protein
MPNKKLQTTLDQIRDGVDSLLALAEDVVAKQQVTKTRKKKSRDELYSSDFMTAWNLYDKKTGKLAAAKAYAAFLKRQSESNYYKNLAFESPHKMLLDKIKGYVGAWPAARIQTGDYRLHMATFLNQDRWMEDPSDWAASDTSFQQAEGPAWTE